MGYVTHCSTNCLVYLCVCVCTPPSLPIDSPNPLSQSPFFSHNPPLLSVPPSPGIPPVPVPLEHRDEPVAVEALPPVMPGDVIGVEYWYQIASTKSIPVWCWSTGQHVLRSAVGGHLVWMRREGQHPVC